MVGPQATSLTFHGATLQLLYRASDEANPSFADVCFSPVYLLGLGDSSGPISLTWSFILQASDYMSLPQGPSIQGSVSPFSFLLPSCCETLKLPAETGS